MFHSSFQQMIAQLDDVIGRLIGVARADGLIIACNDSTRIGQLLGGTCPVQPDNATVSEKITRYPFAIESGERYIAFADGEDREAGHYAQMIAVMLSGISQYREETADNDFIANVLLENLLPDAVGIQAMDLGLDLYGHYGVLLFRELSESLTVTLYDAVDALRSKEEPSYAVHINETDVALVLRTEKDEKGLIAYAEELRRTLRDHFGREVLIGIGDLTEKLSDLPKALRSSQTALDICAVFFPERGVMPSSELGIARLVHQLPATVCRSFLSEVYHKTMPDALDADLLESALCFMQESLNLAAASEKLHIHRNTLVYRLNKIKTETGLDLCRFDEAFLFYVSLFVQKQWKNDPTVNKSTKKEKVD